MHMRDRPSAYEAACIDQPKSATMPGVLSASLAFFGTTAKGGGAGGCRWRTKRSWPFRGRGGGRVARPSPTGQPPPSLVTSPHPLLLPLFLPFLRPPLFSTLPPTPALSLSLLPSDSDNFASLKEEEFKEECE